MTPQFKFLRRVRIHGGECGAVARALHHEVKGSSLYQADSGKALESTNERKQMSTKITLKRIALVAVSAMGFGLMTSVAPANAAATASFSVSDSSITVVTGGTTAASSTYGAVFRIALRNVGTTATDQALNADETLTATVVAVPAGTAGTAKSLASNAADLFVGRAAPGTDNGTTYGNTFTQSLGDTAAATITWGSTATTYENSPVTATQLDNSLYLKVVPATNSVVDEGTYTIRLRLTSNNNALLVQDTLVKVTFVSSAVSSGAKLTVTPTGAFPITTAHDTQTTANSIVATIKDANDGRLVVEASAGTSTAPSLTVDMIDSLGAVVAAATGLTAVDDGSAGDAGYSSSTATTNTTNTRNGTFGIKATSSSFPAAQVGSTNKIRVRYGAATASAAITLINTAVATTPTVSVTGTGKSVLSTANNAWLPLTTKTATVTVSGSANAGKTILFTVTWSGVNSNDVTPEDSEITSVLADAAGTATLTLTNSNPVDGASATVAISGYATANTPDNQVVTWYKSAPQTVSVSNGGAVVALKAATVFTTTVTDRFGAPVAGVNLTPTVTGANNALGTNTYATVTTNAKGEASFTLTDSVAKAAETDKVTMTELTSGTGATGNATITYAAAAPVVASLKTYYSATPVASANTVIGIATLVPAGGIYVDGVSSRFPVQIARDNSRVTTVADGIDQLDIRVNAGVAGAAITATASTGAYVLNSINLQSGSRTQYSAATTFDTYWTVGTNVAGANTITFTSGSVTTAVSFWSSSATTSARFVTLTGPATGTANGALNTYTVTVTDRYGNPMGSQSVSIQASGEAVLGGGGTTSTFTTDSTGTFTFTGTSLNSAGGTGTFKVSVPTTTEFASSAGYSGTTPIDSTVAAANNTASVAVTFAAGTNSAQAAAEAASDAAAEAIDAANAATDAANLAAEAADAATVAAEEARDAADAATAAVEELATQVATLMAALKAQITTLANTVAKIAKKVKA